jgi:hypothetical protein
MVRRLGIAVEITKVVYRVGQRWSSVRRRPAQGDPWFLEFRQDPTGLARKSWRCRFYFDDDRSDVIPLRFVGVKRSAS